MDNVTASEVAGFAVGALLLAATIAAPKVDAFVSASQRRSLRMCARCGDLGVIPCSRCSSGIARLQILGSPNSDNQPCAECGASRRIPCPLCSSRKDV
ncbi:chaperone [Wolffia australiana]